MKVLISDDNTVIQGVLKEILEDTDCKISVSSSVSDTMNVIFRDAPDLMFLDADMENGSGLSVLDRLPSVLADAGKDASSILDIGILVLKSGQRSVPSDNIHVKGTIIKPFKASDVLDKMDALGHSGRGEFGEKHKGSAWERRKARKAAEAEVPDPENVLSSRNLIFGTSYVFFQDNPKQIHETVSLFGQAGYDVLLITSGKVKVTREKFRLNKNLDVISLSVRPRGRYLDIYKLGSMVEDVGAFIENKESPVIAIDNLNYMIERNGSNAVLAMVHEIMTTNHAKKFTVLASVNVSRFTDKDKNILLELMVRYNPEEKK
jgi:CheY-like chemotaxis protein